MLFKIYNKIEKIFICYKYHNMMLKSISQSAECKIKENIPLFSIIMPTYNSNPIFFEKAILSVFGQTLNSWELCICDDGSGDNKYLDTIHKYPQYQSKIKICKLEKKSGISVASNYAIRMANGRYIAFLDHDDELSPDALEVSWNTIAKTDAEILYSDEDKIDESNYHYDPYFKPDWSPDLLMNKMYIGHLSIYDKKVLDDIGGLRCEYDGAQDYDLALRATDKKRIITHIPKVLYHWRASHTSTAQNPLIKKYAFSAAKKALETTLTRRKTMGIVLERESYCGYFEIKYELKSMIKVTIIIMALNTKKLEQCISSVVGSNTIINEVIIIHEKKDTVNVQTLVKKNNKAIKFKLLPLHKNEVLPNGIIKNSCSEHFIIVNSSIGVLTNDWIEKGLGFCQKDDVGLIGVMQLRHRRIYHAGIILCRDGKIRFHHRFFPMNYSGNNIGQLICQSNYSAVSGNCFFMKKKLLEKYSNIILFSDPEYWDVELALRISENGFVNVFLPEIKTQYYGRKQRYDKITKNHDFVERWNRYFKEDPYYNKNLGENAKYLPALDGFSILKNLN